VQSNRLKLILFLVVFVDLLGFGILIPMLPFYARHFSASAFEVGLLMFVYSLMQVFLAPVWGRLSDLFGRKPIILITIGGQAAAFYLGAFAESYLLLLVSRIFAGLFAGNISTAMAYMADITSPEERSRGMGLIGAAFGLGFVFGPAIGGLLIPIGYGAPAFVAGVIATLNLVAGFIFLREPLRDPTQRRANRRRFDWQRLNEVLANMNLFAPIFVFFMFTLAFVNMEISFGLFLKDFFLFSEVQIGFVLAGVGITMAIVQGGLIGKLTDRFREENLISTGSILAAIGLFVLFRSTSYIELFGGLFLLTLGYSILNPCLSSTLSKRAAEDERGAVMGVYHSGGSLARVAGPLMAGALYDIGLRWPFLLASCLVVLGFLFWMNFSRMKQSDES